MERCYNNKIEQSVWRNVKIVQLLLFKGNVPQFIPLWAIPFCYVLNCLADNIFHEICRVNEPSGSVIFAWVILKPSTFFLTQLY